MSHSTGFGPISAVDARVLVLGSLPGTRSLAAGEYYAHPRNVFWRIIEALFRIPADLPYAERVERLRRKRIALWDVLQSSVRHGSLDAAIDIASAQKSDLAAFIEGHRELRLIAFNGRKAAQLFERLVRPGCATIVPRLVTLPSTSPAYAAMPYSDKLWHWSRIRDAAQDRCRSGAIPAAACNARERR